MAQDLGKGIKIWFLFILLIHGSCSRDRDLELGLFDVEGFNVTIKELEYNGFEKVQEDALLFRKKVNGLTIFYEISFDNKKFYSKYWIIEVDNLDELRDLFNKNEYYLIVPYDFNELKQGEAFCVKNHLDNRVMFGNLEKKDRRIILEIKYYNLLSCD